MAASQGPVAFGHGLLVGMPDAVTVVETRTIRMPVTPAIVVTVGVMSWANPDNHAEAVMVMFAFGLTSLSMSRSKSKRCPAIL